MSCVVTDSGPESKGEMFLLASVLVGLEFKQKKRPTKEQKMLRLKSPNFSVWLSFT